MKEGPPGERGDPSRLRDGGGRSLQEAALRRRNLYGVGRTEIHPPMNACQGCANDATVRAHSHKPNPPSVAAADHAFAAALLRREHRTPRSASSSNSGACERNAGSHR